MKDVLVRRVVGVVYGRLSRDWPNRHNRLQLTLSALTVVSAWCEFEPKQN
jgi:hypothetical protein